jgi:hypothetical protein
MSSTEPTKLPGRPQDKVSLINTADDPLGSDRMGTYDIKAKPKSGENSLKVKYQGGSPLALENTTTRAAYYKNKALLEQFGKRNTELYKESDLLNENQIKPDLI